MDDLYRETYRVPSARWAGYDYGQNGAYFITICTKDRQRYFGQIILPDGTWESAVLEETAQARVVRQCWQLIPAHFPFVQLGAFVIMPDHIHGILLFDKPTSELPAMDYQNRFGPQQGNLAAVVRGFKAGVSVQMKYERLPFAWQARYHDRVIRNGHEQERIERYIESNPNRWKDEQHQEISLFR